VAKCIAECFDATISYTTPAYFSMDTPRAVTIIYRGSQAKPMGFVQIDATDTTAPAPDEMSLLLKRPDGSFVTFTTGSTEIFYSSGSGASRLAAQFDATTLATGAYNYTVVARSWRSGAYQEATYPTRVLIENEIGSLVGAGWSIGGFQRIFVQSDASVVITEGDGSIAFFKADLCPVNCNFAPAAGDFTTLTTVGTYPPISGYTRQYPDGTIVTFSTSGLMMSVRDRFGNQTNYGYDASNRLTSITDPAGKAISFGYTGANKLDWIKDPGTPVRTTDITVNAAGDLIEILDAAGVYAWRPSYAADHRMLQRLDRKGSSWGFAYDFSGQLAADTMPTIVADSQSVRPVVQFGSLRRAVLVDPASGMGTSANPAPRVTPANIRASIMNARGFSTLYALDRFGAAMKIEAPLGSTETIGRNSQSQVIADTAPSGHVIEYTWSGPRLAQTVDRATGRTIQTDYELTYNEPTKLYGDIDTVANAWTSGKLISTHRSNQPATTFTYDTKGRVLTETDPLHHLTTNYYAGTGWQNTDSAVTSGMRTAYTYDGYGRRSTTKDPANWIVTVLFDSINRAVRKIGPIGDTTRIAYDSLYVRTITDAIGQTYQYSRNALGWIETRIDPGSRQETYAYDRNGNRIRWRNRRNQTVVFSYDALDHMTSRIADGVTTTYQTDPLLRFRSAANPESSDTLKWDAAGRPQSEITILAGTRYERRSSYEIRDLRTSLEMVSPWDDTISYRYNLNMLLDTLIDLRSGRTTLRYNADLILDTIALAPPGLLISLIPQPNHVYSQITYPNDAFTNSLVGLEFATNSRGLIDAHGKVGWDTSWTTLHDPLGRVSEFLSQPFTFDSFYTYDKVGNRKDLGRHVIAGNRLDTFNGDSLFYDADGNLTKRRRGAADVQRLYWNSLSQLIAVWTSGSDSITLGYDGFGRRVRKTSPLQTVRYLWDNDDLLAELNVSGTRSVEYAYYPGVDRPHSMRRNGPTWPVLLFHAGYARKRGSCFRHGGHRPGGPIPVYAVRDGHAWLSLRLSRHNQHASIRGSAN
jgi:YD repeat-containing protein